MKAILSTKTTPELMKVLSGIELECQQERHGGWGEYDSPMRLKFQREGLPSWHSAQLYCSIRDGQDDLTESLPEKFTYTDKWNLLAYWRAKMCAVEAIQEGDKIIFLLDGARGGFRRSYMAKQFLWLLLLLKEEGRLEVEEYISSDPDLQWWELGSNSELEQPNNELLHPEYAPYMARSLEGWVVRYQCLQAIASPSIGRELLTNPATRGLLRESLLGQMSEGEREVFLQQELEAMQIAESAISAAAHGDLADGFVEAE